MIVVKNRTMVIPKIERTLGTFQDTNTETRLFKIDRFTEGTADISHLLFKLISRNENGVENPIHLEKAVTEDAIYLTWQVISNDIGVSGTLLCQIQGFDDQGICRWNSFIGAFYVEQNLGGDIDPERLSDYEALQLRLEKALQEIEDANYMKAEDLPIASKDIAGMVKIGYGLAVDPDGTVYVVAVGGEGGVSSYLALTDKPMIEGVVLSGDKTLKELGIQPAGEYLTPDNAPVGGYYIPHVLEDGTLAWTKTKEDMEDVPGANIIGPRGDTGKTAFEYAVDGGYTGTEEEFAAKLAEEAVLKKDTVSFYEDLGGVTEAGKWLDAKAAKDGFEAQGRRISDIETAFRDGCKVFVDDLATHGVELDENSSPQEIVEAYNELVGSGYELSLVTTVTSADWTANTNNVVETVELAAGKYMIFAVRTNGSGNTRGTVSPGKMTVTGADSVIELGGNCAFYVTVSEAKTITITATGAGSNEDASGKMYVYVYQ